jgi:hypothetical protein
LLTEEEFNLVKEVLKNGKRNWKSIKRIRRRIKVDT